MKPSYKKAILTLNSNDKILEYKPEKIIVNLEQKSSNTLSLSYNDKSIATVTIIGNQINENTKIKCMLNGCSEFSIFGAYSHIYKGYHCDLLQDIGPKNKETHEIIELLKSKQLNGIPDFTGQMLYFSSNVSLDNCTIIVSYFNRNKLYISSEKECKKIISFTHNPNKIFRLIPEQNIISIKCKKSVPCIFHYNTDSYLVEPNKEITFYDLIKDRHLMEYTTEIHGAGTVFGDIFIEFLHEDDICDIEIFCYKLQKNIE